VIIVVTDRHAGCYCPIHCHGRYPLPGRKNKESWLLSRLKVAYEGKNEAKRGDDLVTTTKKIKNHVEIVYNLVLN
jgi:hypothetical protein